jgi:hypothetical protein
MDQERDQVRAELCCRPQPNQSHQVRESVRRQKHDEAAQGMRKKSDVAHKSEAAQPPSSPPRRRVAAKPRAVTHKAVSAQQKRKEAERFTAAMLSQIRFKCKTMGTVLPPICRCQFVHWRQSSHTT